MDVVRTPATGWIEVVVGSMFSGKSEELIRRLRRAQIARQRVQIFKPAVDTRYATDHIVSHSELRIPSESAATAAELLEAVRPDTEVVGIDEGQFFDAGLPAVATELARRGVRVIVAGLDQDYLGKPFEPMPQLLAIAEYITKTRAICMVCGNPANHTQRLVVSSDRVLLGAQGTYEARCRHCFDPTLSREEETRATRDAAAEKSAAGRAALGCADSPAPFRQGSRAHPCRGAISARRAPPAEQARVAVAARKAASARAARIRAGAEDPRPPHRGRGSRSPSE